MQVLYDEGKISSKEEMRFNSESNVINKVLGFPGHDEPTFTVLDNSEYYSLIVVSDGVSDYLSEDDIKIICEKTPIEELAKALSKAANYKRSKGTRETGEHVVKPGGGDNATTAVTYNDR